MYVVILVVYNAKDHNVLVQHCVHDSCNCSLIRIAYLKYRWPRSDKWYIHKLHKYYIPRTSVRIYCSFFFFFLLSLKNMIPITAVIGLPWNGNVQGRSSHSGIKSEHRILYYIKRTLLCTQINKRQARVYNICIILYIQYELYEDNHRNNPFTRDL